MKFSFYILFLLLLMLFSIEGLAQTVEDKEGVSIPQDSLKIEDDLIPESLDVNVDSLLHSWHVRYFFSTDENCHNDSVAGVVYPDSIYRNKLESLVSIIPMEYNMEVKKAINKYVDSRRMQVEYMLGMAAYYFPIIEQTLDRYDLPLELKYLVVVESGLNPMALSRVGASGLWQFMLPTGKTYGLEINSLIDERRDPIKSTVAACHYLKDLYAIYQDWNLALAAYNCGPGNVNKAIRRSGGKQDFWGIFNYLPRQTRLYVPYFIAANYVMNYYCDHNLCPMGSSLPFATDTLMVNELLHFEQIAEKSGVDIEMIRALNPQYKRDVIPGNAKPYVLVLPASASFSLAGSEDDMYAFQREDYFPDEVLKCDKRKERIKHKVRAGENTYIVADKYGISAKELRRQNGLRRNRLRRGTMLTLWVDNGGLPFNIKEGNSKESEKLLADETMSYEVKSGDSLYTIAKRFPGVSVKDLKIVNGLRGNMIHPGQRLIVP